MDKLIDLIYIPVCCGCGHRNKLTLLKMHTGNAKCKICGHDRFWIKGV